MALKLHWLSGAMGEAEAVKRHPQSPRPRTSEPLEPVDADDLLPRRRYPTAQILDEFLKMDGDMAEVDWRRAGYRSAYHAYSLLKGLLFCRRHYGSSRYGGVRVAKRGDRVFLVKEGQSG